MDIKLSKKQWIQILSVFFIYLGSFLLISYDSSLNFLGSSSNFFKAMVNTFQGAGAIAIITTLLIVFQSSIQSTQDKDKKVFDEKITLLNDIIDSLHNIVKDKKVNEEELQKLYFEEKKLELICGQEVVDSFQEVILNIKDYNEEEFKMKFEIFITYARQDLNLTVIKKSIKQVIGEKEEKKKNEKESNYSADNDKLKEDDWLNQILKKLKSKGGDNVLESYSKTGGCTIKVNGRKLINFGSNEKIVGILIMRDYKRGYKKPDDKNLKGATISNIRKYDPTYDNHTEENPHPSYTVPWGYAFYEIKIDKKHITTKVKDEIEKFIDDGYNTIIDNEILKVTMKDHERLKDIFGS